MKFILLIGIVIIVTLLILRLKKRSHTSIEHIDITDSTNDNTDNYNDNDVLEIYIDEAEEVFQVIKEKVDLLASNPDANQLASITDIRRSFHTLKGAARMVGLNEIANHAERTEMHLNAILDKSQAYSPETIEVVNKSKSEIKRLTDELKIKINYENA